MKYILRTSCHLRRSPRHLHPLTKYKHVQIPLRDDDFRRNMCIADYPSPFLAQAAYCRLYSAFKKLGRRLFFSHEIHARKDNSVATLELHVETK